jgi:hypothetical protein
VFRSIGFRGRRREEREGGQRGGDEVRRGTTSNAPCNHIPARDPHDEQQHRRAGAQRDEQMTAFRRVTLGSIWCKEKECDSYDLITKGVN